MEWKRKIGQRFAIGISGTGVDESLRDFVRHYQVGNFILFRENLLSAPQARELCRELQALGREVTGYPPLICADQEGGMVARLPRDMVNVPGAMALAATGEPSACHEAALVTAGELARVGINMNLAPVMDVNCNGQNPVIGVRSYGDTPERVRDFALEAIRGCQEAGMLCAAKHFPGHGDTHLDSHLALPAVEKSREELEKMELLPFRAAVKAGVPAIMTAHILFPALERERLPATMSREILTGLLRGEMDFDGLILSDAMEMEAVKAHFGTPQGCVAALRAGVDIVFVCHDREGMAASVEAARKAYREGTLSLEEMDASLARIVRHKQRFLQEGPALEALAWEGTALEMRRAQNAALMRRILTPVNKEPRPLPALGEKPFCVGSLAYRTTLASSAPDSALSFAQWLGEALGGTWLETPVSPDEEAIAKAVREAAGASGIVVGTYNGHLNRQQIALARALAGVGEEWGIPVVAVALRNPYDLALLPDTLYKLAVYEYSQNSLEALAEALTGRLEPRGRLSVRL